MSRILLCSDGSGGTTLIPLSSTSGRSATTGKAVTERSECTICFPKCGVGTLEEKRKTSHLLWDAIYYSGASARFQVRTLSPARFGTSLPRTTTSVSTFPAALAARSRRYRPCRYFIKATDDPLPIIRGHACIGLSKSRTERRRTRFQYSPRKSRTGNCSRSVRWARSRAKTACRSFWNLSKAVNSRRKNNITHPSPREFPDERSIPFMAKLLEERDVM